MVSRPRRNPPLRIGQGGQAGAGHASWGAARRRMRPVQTLAGNNSLEARVLMMPMPRLRSLQERHATLERQIAEEGNRPQPDAGALGRLKRAKLKLKEEMERLRPAR